MQCHNGHIFCGDCLRAHQESGRGEASGKCPTCRVALGAVPIRNRIAESAIGNLPGNCGGCGERMLRKDLSAHMSTCGQVMVQCTFPNCTARVRRDELAAHMSSAAKTHLELAQALAADLESARGVLGNLTIKLKVGGIRPARPIDLELKLMQPIGEQDAFRNAIPAIAEFHFDYDIRKSPHALGLRDGATLVAKKNVLTIRVREITVDAQEPVRFTEYRLKAQTKLQKLMDTFRARTGARPSDNLTFFFNVNGSMNVIHRDDTPESLGMSDGDIVRVLRGGPDLQGHHLRVLADALGARAAARLRDLAAGRAANVAAAGDVNVQDA